MSYSPAIDIKPDESIKAIVARTFPDYRGRKYHVQVHDVDFPVDVTSYWSGGSRDYFAAINLATMETVVVPQNGTPFDGGPIRPGGVIIPTGFAIVEHSIFCGKDIGITVHVGPEMMPKFIEGR